MKKGPAANEIWYTSMSQVRASGRYAVRSVESPTSEKRSQQRPDRVLAQFLRTRCRRVAISLRNAEFRNGHECRRLLGIQSTATGYQIRRKL